MTTKQTTQDQESSTGELLGKLAELAKVAASNIFTGLCLGVGGVLATKAMGLRGVRLLKGKTDAQGNVFPLNKKSGTNG